MEVMQKFASLIGIKNEIKQYVNSYENKELINHLLGGEFKKIEEIIAKGNLDDARTQIDIILCKKEVLPEELELRLKFLKGSIELELENYYAVEFIIESLGEKELGNEYSLELKYKYSLYTNNESLMEECIKELEEKKESDVNIVTKKVMFYACNSNFKKTLELLDYINSKEIKDKNIYYYIAVSYLNLRDYLNAKKFAQKSIDEGIGEIGKYVYILSDVNPILQRRGIAVTISENEKNILDFKAKELISIVEKVPNELYIEINLVIINIYLIIDIEKAKQVFDEKEGLIINTLEGKLAKARIEEICGDYEKAKNIYLDILEIQFSEEVLINTMACMSITSDYNLYISIFEKYRDKILDDEFILHEFYLKSIKNIYSIDKMIEEIEKIRDKYSDNVRFNIFIVNNCYNEPDKYKQLIKIENMIHVSNEFDRDELANSFWKISKFDDAMRVIKPLLKYRDVLATVIRKVVSSNKAEYYMDLIKEVDKHNDISLMKYKIEMLYFLNEKEEAKRVAQSIYEAEFSQQSLCRLIDLKLELNDSLGIENLLNKLIPSKKPMDYMRVACGYALLGDLEKCNSYSYEAIFMTNGIVEKRIYSCYVSMRLRLACLKKEEQKSIDKVKEETVVVLKNESKTINICLNAEEKYQTNKEVFRCLHIDRNNPLWIELIEQRVGDIIYYDGEEFIIESINDKNVIISQYCFSKLDNISDGLPIKAVTIDELPEAMKSISESSEKSYETKFEMYDFKYNKMGLPFSKVFYSNDLKLSIELLNIMLLNKRYSFYIGAPKTSNTSDKFVLSYQTLLLLEHYNMLELLKVEPQKYYVSKSLKNAISNSIIDTKRNLKQLKIGYSLEVGSLYKDEVDYSEVLKKLKNIFAILQYINVKEANYEIRDNLINISRNFISDIDIDSIYLAVDLDATIILDDLFTQKLINSNEQIKHINYINISYFLNILSKVDLVKYYDTVKLMLSNNIKYILDKDEFKNIIQSYKEKSHNIQWFEEFIRAMDIEDEYYREIILNACRELYSLNYFNKYINELFVIIKVLKLA